MNNFEIVTDDMTAMVPIMTKFLLNTLIVWIITHWLYFPKSRQREYYFTFMLMAVSVFFLINLLGDVQIKIEFALGLFAVFGIIRYRTESMPVREMTYLFLILALSVINGLSANMGWATLIGVNLLFILTTWLFESIKVKGCLAVKLVQYDRIELIKPDQREQLIADLCERTGLDIVKVEVGGIDFLRDMSVIKIYYHTTSRSSVDDQLKVHSYEYEHI